MLADVAGTLYNTLIFNTLIVVMATLAFHVFAGVGTAFAVPVRIRRGPALPKTVASVVSVAR